MRSRLLRLVLVVVMALSVVAIAPAIALAEAAPHHTERVIGGEKGLTANPRIWGAPAVANNWVVWQVRYSASADWDVWAYNLQTGTQKRCSGVTTGLQTVPRISGNWVVYLDTRNGNREVYAYNLSTNEERRVTSTPAFNENGVDISGDRIVWSDGADVWVYRISTKKTEIAAGGTGNQVWPAVSGDRVAYMLSANIWVKDLTTGQNLQITSDANVQQLPDIDGTRVVWEDFATGNYDIKMYDFVTGSVTTVADEAYNLTNAQVSDTHVVWEDWENGSGNRDIRMKDLALGAGYTLADSGSQEGLPAIYNGNVVYTYGSDYGQGTVNLARLSMAEFKTSAPSTISYATKATISGSVAINGIPLGWRDLEVWRANDFGKTWAKVATIKTGSDGSYAYVTPALTKKAYFRFFFAGEKHQLIANTVIDEFSSLSAYKVVTPRVSLGKPAGYPSTGYTSRTYSVYGSLKPKHPASAASKKVVVIKCYRRESGKWKLRKTVDARVYDYSTYSRYRGSVKLPYKGSWRIRAYYAASGTNASTWSASRYVTVK